MKNFLSLMIILTLAFTTCCSASTPEPASVTPLAPTTETVPSQTQTLSDAEAAFEAADTFEKLGALMKPYITAGDYESALLYANKMLEIDPTNPDAYYAQAEVRLLLLQAECDMLNDVLANSVEYVDDSNGYFDFVERLLEETDLTVIFPFTPDYNSENEINKDGISAGNQTNAAKYSGEWRGGLLTWQGDWVYLSRPDENFAIYKVRSDGSEYQKIGENCGSGLNVVGDWLYYINIADYKPYRMRTDGSMNEKVSDDDCSFLSVSGDWMYYNNGSDNGCLYKTRIDGSESLKLSQGMSIFICVVDGYVYYAEKSMEGGLVRISVEGGKSQLVASGFIQNYCVLGDWLYYINQEDSYSIRRVHTDGTEDNELYRFDFPIASFNVSNDTLYFAFGAGYEEDGFHISQDIISLDLETLSLQDHIGADTEPLCVGPNGRLYFLSFREGLVWYVMDTGGAVTKIE